MSKFDIEEKIVAMLKTVFDPEIPVDVYDLYVFGGCLVKPIIKYHFFYMDER